MSNDTAGTKTDFTRQQFEWLDQVLGDPKRPASAFLVAYLISRHINRETREAWPSLNYIADKTGLSKTTVIKAVEFLNARGHLKVTPGQPGRGKSSCYATVLKGTKTDLLGSTAMSNKRYNFGEEKVTLL